ncbi:hypothetical protein NPF39_001038 [Salmonella enterica subsp. enterica serovar Uganda]|nr:hypothetical protein [Salmonella enterica subsp. enterica serovar Uganda]EIL2948586.1 hypothetical protein [Salmonella enterica subsp. enterica serovar Uganda]EIX2952284.1 hypothetical protein [Salmonella enterica subsp. enterica serovar Uganda]EJN2431604.1 hypothetical protein [Salmonella enterica subsp. enterica serovar Uganda]HEH9008946.1 hypothetical protein [Salmonella enterica]
MALNYFGQAFRLAFEISPILLVDGIAADIPGGIMPIAVLTEGVSIADGLLHGDIGTGPTAHFTPMAGTTLVQQEIGNLNFYNMLTAANAVVGKPNRIVMQMLRPASTQDGGYATKGLAFSAMKMALDKHNQSGGSYVVMTPVFIYTGCLMRSLTDASGFSDQNKQVQETWQFEFEQPLLTISRLDAALGGVMSKFESGLPPTFPADSMSWNGNGDVIPALPKF